MKKPDEGGKTVDKRCDRAYNSNKLNIVMQNRGAAFMSKIAKEQQGC